MPPQYTVPTAKRKCLYCPIDLGRDLSGTSTVAVPMSSGRCAIVDEEDYPLVCQYPWQERTVKSGGSYAQVVLYHNNEPRTLIMHRIIMNAPEGVMVDHKNRNGLDNRKQNLRFATQSQNSANSGPRSGRYKGVSLRKQDGRWEASIRHDGKCHWLGFFETPEDAAKAYDQEAYRMHGEFAYLNFPEELDMNTPIERSTNAARGTIYQRRYPDGIPAEDDLPHADRRVYQRRWDVALMHVNDRLSYQEIAEREGLSLSAVRSYIWDALKAYERAKQDFADLGGVAGIIELRNKRRRM